MTTLASIFQTKLVSQMMIKADQTKLENFTCFNGFLAFSEIMMSLKSQTLVYGLHYCYCSKFLFVLINKYFYYKIKYFAMNKINCRLKYVILLICSILVFL